MENVQNFSEAKVEVDLKKCTRKEHMLPATTEYFPKNKASKDGLGHWCRACHKDYRMNKSVKDAIAKAEVGIKAVEAGAEE